MSPTSNSSLWVTTRSEDRYRATPTAPSPQGTDDPAAPALDWTSASIPTVSRSAPPPSSQITDAVTSYP